MIKGIFCQLPTQKPISLAECINCIQSVFLSVNFNNQKNKQKGNKKQLLTLNNIETN